MNFRVMTFNIQHGRNHNLEGDVIDVPFMAKTALALDPAIINFNEVRKGINGEESTNCFFPDEPAILEKEIGGKAYFAKAISVKENCLYGNCLLTKFPLISAETVMIPDPAPVENVWHETRCMIKSEIPVGDKKITVLTSHFGLSHEEQVNCVDTVLKAVAEAESPIIFMGDLNMTDDDPLIQKLASVMTDSAAYVNNKELTFPSNDPKIRIDYIFTKDIKIHNVFANKVVASDHFGLVADLEV